jgi:hypothetical protein
MSIEALKQQLAEGKITKEQFAAELKKLLDAGTIDQAAYDAAIAEANNSSGGGGSGGALTAEQVQAMIAEAVKKAEQSAGDKVRTEYAAKLKAEQEEKDRLLKEKMSDEEKAKFEREKLQKYLEEREKSLKQREVALHTIDKLTEAKLPLSFKDFLVADTTEDADKNIAAFQTAWQAAIKAEVDAKFKEHGSDPGKGKGGAGTNTVNPWKAETFNLTKQAQILKDDPELAKQLMAQAGK